MTNEEFNNALQNKEFRTIMNYASSGFKTRIPYDEMKSLQLESLYNSLNDYDEDRPGKNSFKSYLFLRVKWACLKYIDSCKKDKSRATPFEDMDFLIREEQGNFEEMIEGLSEKEKEILRYRFIHGMTLEEIGKIYDISYEMVRKYIQKSLLKLKENYVS